MDKKLIKEAFVEAAGKQAEPLVDFLDGKKYTNEFLIAKKFDLPINQARNVLYKIAERNLVSSTRKKDKKKGWYTYSWKIEELKSLEFLRSLLVRKIEQLKNQINNRETREFYVCDRCHVEFNEENALLHDFTCPECGSVLVLKDNTKLVKEFRKNLDNYEGDLKIIDDEIAEEKAAEAKKIHLKEAALKREKAKARALATEKRRADAKKLKEASNPKKKAAGKAEPKKSGPVKSSEKKSSKKPAKK